MNSNGRNSGTARMRADDASALTRRRWPNSSRPIFNAVLLGCALLLGACNMVKPSDKADINDKTKFSQQEYQVAASPRVTVKKAVPKGGGRYQVGKPYKVRDKWYKPKEDPGYSAVGLASWYGPNFHGRLTANGEVFDQYALSAAHPTLPLPSYVRVTNLDNGSSLIVRVNDRGPFAHNRVIDLSARAARMLGYANDGVAKVKVDYVGTARLDGRDEKFLLASYRGPGMPDIEPGATQPGTMLALATEPVPATPVQSTLEERIEVAISGVPVPTERPVTLDGVPFEILPDEPIMTASLSTLGYRQEDPNGQRVAAAFALMDRGDDVRLPAAGNFREDISKAAIIRLGVFAEGSHAEYVRGVFADLGVTSKRRVVVNRQVSWEVRLMAGGDVADAVLDIAHERGLTDAERVTR